MSPSSHAVPGALQSDKGSTEHRSSAGKIRREPLLAPPNERHRRQRTRDADRDSKRQRRRKRSCTRMRRRGQSRRSRSRGSHQSAKEALDRPRRSHPHSRKIDDDSRQQSRRASPKVRQFSRSQWNAIRVSSPLSSPMRSDSAEACDGKLQQLTFHAFVKKEITREDAAEEAIEKYAQYQRRCLEVQLQNMNDSALLFDHYNPIALRKAHDYRVDLAKENAKTFVADLEMNRYSGVRLCSTSSSIHAGHNLAPWHMTAPHFAFDADVNTLLIQDISPDTSIWSLEEKLGRQSGLIAMSSPEPPGSGFMRELCLRFQTAEQAKAAQQVLQSGDEIQSRISSRIPRHGQCLSHTVAPAEMSRPRQIRDDADLSAAVIRKLDGLVGIDPHVTFAVLNKAEADEERLDLQVLYLRRVHHFCFYKAEWCRDEWDLRHRCGVCPSLRLVPGSEEALRDDGDWTKALEAGLRIQEHNQRIQEFLTGASLERPALPSAREEPLRGRILAICQERTIEAAPQKFQCTVCKKCFKGPEYTHRHLQQVHKEIFQPVLRQACHEAACAAYMADPNRPPAATLSLAGA